MAALEIIVISGTKADPETDRFAYDPCGPSKGNRKATNNFQPTAGGGTISGKTFAYRANLNTIQNGFIARIIPLYSSTVIAVSGGASSLPAQGSIITSVGSSQSTSRKILLYQGYPELPSEFFPYVLFSPR
jgi:hypothetical protein